MTEIIAFPKLKAVALGDSSKLLTSTQYRLRASALARTAEAQDDDEEARLLLQLATSWIELAENEEWLASSYWN